MRNEIAAKQKQRSVVPPFAAEHWMSLEEACTTLARSRFTIAKMCREKILDRLRDGQRVLISRPSVARWIKRYQLPLQKPSRTARKAK